MRNYIRLLPIDLSKDELPYDLTVYTLCYLCSYADLEFFHKLWNKYFAEASRDNTTKLFKRFRNEQKCLEVSYISNMHQLSSVLEQTNENIRITKDSWKCSLIRLIGSTTVNYDIDSISLITCSMIQKSHFIELINNLTLDGCWEREPYNHIRTDNDINFDRTKFRVLVDHNQLTKLTNTQKQITNRAVLEECIKKGVTYSEMPKNFLRNILLPQYLKTDNDNINYHNASRVLKLKILRDCKISSEEKRNDLLSHIEEPIIYGRN